MPADATPTKSARKIVEERILKEIYEDEVDKEKEVRESEATDKIPRPNECTLVSEERKRNR